MDCFISCAASFLIEEFEPGFFVNCLLDCWPICVRMSIYSEHYKIAYLVDSFKLQHSLGVSV